MSGIQRSVFLHARPKTYIRDFFALCDLAENYSDGLLKLNAELAGIGPEEDELMVEASLFDNGQKLYSEAKPAKSAEGKAEVNFEKSFQGVKRWSAETPDLYSTCDKS